MSVLRGRPLTAFSPVVIGSSGVLLLLGSFLINLCLRGESSTSSGFWQFVNNTEHSALSLINLSVVAEVQPRLIQGIRRRDGIGDLFKC